MIPCAGWLTHTVVGTSHAEVRNPSDEVRGYHAGWLRTRTAAGTSAVEIENESIMNNKEVLMSMESEE
jgi:hypothetical protein